MRCIVELTFVDQAKEVDEHPLVWLGFEEDCIITACKDGKQLTIHPLFFSHRSWSFPFKFLPIFFL